MAANYSSKLNPYHRLREPHGAQGLRQSVCITNNPSTINANQQLIVHLPSLGKDDVIIPWISQLGFMINFHSKGPNITVVQNLGHNIIKKIVIRIYGNEILSVDDCNLFYTYQDLWLTRGDR